MYKLMSQTALMELFEETSVWIMEVQMLQSMFIFLLSIFITLPALSETATDEKGWTVWANLEGEITSDPGACTAGNLTFVFARGTDNEIWYRIRNLPTGLWREWKKMPIMYSHNQQIKSSGAPTALCYHSSNAESVLVSVVGSDNRVWGINGWATANADSFATWFSYPGFTAASFSGPALAGWGGNRVHYFVRGGDNRTYVKTLFNTTSTPFQLLVSEFSYNDPTAVMPSDDRVDFFYRDQYGKLWQQFMVGTLWYPPELISGATYSSPEVISRDIYSLDLFARGPNNTIIHKRSINGVWGSWVSLGGSVASGPGAATYASNARMMVFVRWIDGSLRYKAWAP
jgi:hypothetical protein